MRDNKILRESLRDCEERAETAVQSANKGRFSAQCITEQCVSIYTGLKTIAPFSFFVSLFHNVPMYIPNTCTLDDVVLIVLMKLGLSLLNIDLCHRFGLSEGTLGRIMTKNIPLIASELRRFIIWPSREDAYRTMPMTVRRKYPNCIAIIDCTEIEFKDHLAFHQGLRLTLTTKARTQLSF